MNEDVAIRKVEIDPVGCYRQALELVSERYWLLLGVSAVGMVIGGAVPVVLIGPMMCGLYMCFLERYRGRDFEFDLLFKGFDLFVPSLVASLIMTGVMMLLLIPVCMLFFASAFMAAASSQAEGGQAVVATIASLGAVFAVFLLIALMAAVGMFFFFTFPLIVDRKLTGTAAIGVSARAVAKNFWGVLGLTLIGVVLGLVGVLACYVGSFFLLPISLAAMTIAYRKVFPEIVAEAPSTP